VVGITASLAAVFLAMQEKTEEWQPTDQLVGIMAVAVVMEHLLLALVLQLVVLALLA